jgi:hypothetical protein
MAKRSSSRRAAAQRPAPSMGLPRQNPPVLRGRSADPLRRRFATLQASPEDCRVLCSRLTGLARQICIQQCLNGQPA